MVVSDRALLVEGKIKPRVVLSGRCRSDQGRGKPDGTGTKDRQQNRELRSDGDDAGCEVSLHEWPIFLWVLARLTGGLGGIDRHCTDAQRQEIPSHCWLNWGTWGDGDTSELRSWSCWTSRVRKISKPVHNRNGDAKGVGRVAIRVGRQPIARRLTLDPPLLGGPSGPGDPSGPRPPGDLEAPGCLGILSRRRGNLLVPAPGRIQDCEHAGQIFGWSGSSGGGGHEYITFNPPDTRWSESDVSLRRDRWDIAIGRLVCSAWHGDQGQSHSSPTQELMAATSGRLWHQGELQGRSVANLPQPPSPRLGKDDGDMTDAARLVFCTCRQIFTLASHAV
nr:hypothetical protein CFP56_52178 [Quercus suber]